MTYSSQILRITSLLAVLSFALVSVATATIGNWWWTGPEDRVANGVTYLRFPATGVTLGINHALDPADWYSYRVRVKHSDAAFPNIGWTSDNFTPTANRIQLCDDTGCEAPEVNVGTETLDWTDTSKMSVFLEAKSCVLCTWESNTLEFNANP